MANPVTGPFTSFPSEPFADNYRYGFRQKMPIDRPLEYRFYRYYGTSSTVSWAGDAVSYSPPTKEANFNISSMPDYAARRAACYNLAYERLRSQAYDHAGWAENFAQFGKSAQMVVGRLEQISQFSKAVSHRRFRDAARILRTPLPSGVSNRKAVSQNFLEYEYGLKPLISDIQTSLEILTNDLSFNKRIRGRATERFVSNVRTGGGFGSNPTYSYFQYDIIDGFLTITCRATLKVTNPNLYLANQLGLIDPALPWKLIPFSFIVDWFVNVEQVISSYTDWFGVTLLDPHYSEYRIGKKLSYYFQDASYTSGYSEGFRTVRDKDSVEFDRVMGIPGPSLVVKPFRGFSVERGLQAAALILSVLGR